MTAAGSCLFCWIVCLASACYWVWWLFSCDTWDCMQTVPGRVDCTTSCWSKFVLERNIPADELDYVAAVSRVVLPPVTVVLLNYPLSEEEIRCRESSYCLCRAWAIRCRTWADAVSAVWSCKQSIFVLETEEAEALALLHHDWCREICEDTSKFYDYDLHGRIRRRQKL